MKKVKVIEIENDGNYRIIAKKIGKDMARLVSEYFDSEK